MKVEGAVTIAWLSSAALALSPLRSGHLMVAPALPLGLYDRLRALESSPAAFPASSSQGQVVFSPGVQSDRDRLKGKYPAHTFEQRTSHDAAVPPEEGRETFKQRYWFDASHYQPGGPVIFLNGGETDAEVRLPFLETGIVNVLIQATGGIGVIHEHRYYGQSFPVDDLSTDSFRYLTTVQSLEDANHFANNIVFPGLEHLNLTSKDVPWISYGGSYAGAQSAFLRKNYPETWHGAIASSAVTEAITDYWQYYEPIRQNAPCGASLSSHARLIDAALSLNQPMLTSALKGFFGLGGVTSDVDFVNALSIPLGFWQARNWDPAVSTTAFDDFCEAAGASSDELSAMEALLEHVPKEIANALTSLGRAAGPLRMFTSLASYASYIRENIASICPSVEEQDDCFGTSEYSRQNETIEGGEWKAWPYQFCTEWGYFQGAAPEGEESIVSRLLTTDYTSQICQLAFPEGKMVKIPETPNVEIINQYGGFELEASRLAFIDGSADPWIYATPHSPSAAHPNRKDSLDKPFKLIPGGVHHWDENGLSKPSKEPSEIQEIHAAEVEFVKSWLKEWREPNKGRWRPEETDA